MRNAINILKSLRCVKNVDVLYQLKLGLKGNVALLVNGKQLSKNERHTMKIRCLDD